MQLPTEPLQAARKYVVGQKTTKTKRATLPVSLSDVKVGLDLVDDGAFPLVELAAGSATRRDVHDQPLLMPFCRDRVEPLADLSPERGPVDLVVLRAPSACQRTDRLDSTRLDDWNVSLTSHTTKSKLR